MMVGKAKRLKEFTYGKHDTLIYLGTMYPEYYQEECSILNRSRTGQETYKVRFADGKVFTIPVVALKKKNEQLTLQI